MRFRQILGLSVALHALGVAAFFGLCGGDADSPRLPVAVRLVGTDGMTGVMDVEFSRVAVPEVPRVREALPGRATVHLPVGRVPVPSPGTALFTADDNADRLRPAEGWTLQGLRASLRDGTFASDSVAVRDARQVALETAVRRWNDEFVDQLPDIRAEMFQRAFQRSPFYRF